MSFLIVAGTAIPIAPGTGKRDVDDNVDRRRAFDNTMRVSQTGTAKRTWNFSTPPILRSDADTYDALVSTVASQSCSGDVLGGSVTCFSKRTGWEPVIVPAGHRVVLSFSLDEA